MKMHATMQCLFTEVLKKKPPFDLEPMKDEAKNL